MGNRRETPTERSDLYQQVYRNEEIDEPTQPRKIEVEKHDLSAMMCSAYLIFIPICLVVLLAMCLFAYFFFAR